MLTQNVGAKKKEGGDAESYRKGENGVAMHCDGAERRGGWGHRAMAPKRKVGGDPQLFR